MKLNKKKVFVVAIALCLVAVLSVGTLAWFSASESVKNTFKVATSDNQGTPDFSVDLYENLVDENGKFADTNNDGKIDDQDGVTRDGNTYNAILPGDELDKNPTVKNTGDYDQYIRVVVTLTKADVWAKALVDQGIAADLDQIFTGYDNTLWSSEIEDGNALDDGKITNVYYLKKTLKPDETATLFTGLTIPFQLEEEDMVYGADGFDLEIEAQAVQADNTGDNAKDAFNLVLQTQTI